MNTASYKISRKYAIAFLNLFNNKINEKSFLNIIDFLEFLKKNQNLLTFFTLPHLSDSTKNNFIDLLISKFDLPLEFKLLFNLLLKNNRLYLLKRIIVEIILLYQKISDISFFKISSANLLNDSELIYIKNFIKNKTGKNIIESFTIDRNLIAGIKLQSDTFLWEYSVAKQLKNIKKCLI